MQTNPWEEDWISIDGMLRIPAAWSYTVDDGDTDAPLWISIFGVIAGEPVSMALWGVTVGNPYMIVDEFHSQEEFKFDNGIIWIYVTGTYV